MKDKNRAARFSFERRQDLTWPTPVQALRQLGLIVLAVALGSALLAGCLGSTGPSDAEPTAVQPEPTEPVVAPTDTLASPTEPVVAPTDTLAPPTEVVVTPTSEPTPEPTPEPTSLPAVSFSADVLPLLQGRCVQCHGPSRSSAGLAVDSYAAVMAGSRAGPVIVPGDAAASRLVQMVVSGDMPRGGPKLSPAEIDLISAWVDAGAPDN